MYWNLPTSTSFHVSTGLTLTWDVLKLASISVSLYIVYLININMRCIEINIQMFLKWSWQGLTLTWDVLKLQGRQPCIWWVARININMRCIEMLDSLAIMNVAIRININMRCIEIWWSNARAASSRLTLTWDVLK